ncbi:hypothetical protein JCM19240_3909 [Vibrio maritimus]|uniref:Uncharacterized protein n=1 Tax=Vibrio maritimus TaxID=990268 RepID=A0A090TCC4_9VIBR|nr:hypothetical protein JCM19240_3909 [Vibrio maritimus]
MSQLLYITTSLIAVFEESRHIMKTLIALSVLIASSCALASERSTFHFL